MTKLIVVLLIGLVFEAVGVVLLSQGLHEIGEVKQISAGEIARIIEVARATATSSWAFFSRRVSSACCSISCPRRM